MYQEVKVVIDHPVFTNKQMGLCDWTGVDEMALWLNQYNF